ncbi:hypothetical protein [Actinomycetospora termitidis]|uniref:SRPBCC family protein n=1 Tax=Actinomycetospora termitidis TaxID=3053470 RepID=A0ABT7M9N3_9PSEU|nr:hypothetical protein [Actinomycetospora sp. Odt1-22]MDL5157323.1 hypothetical protein [Actinomycetospora sp. Odt1-22]
MSHLAGPDQPVPPGWRRHEHVQRFVVAAPRERVWAWLNDPATFTDTQIPPWRVEFLGGGFDEGTVTTHHGPGLHLPGVLAEIRDGEHRDLQYLYGAYAISFRLLRPTRLWIAVADAPDGDTEVEIRIDAHVHPRMLRLWALSQRLFWRRFETWAARATAST